MNHQFSQHYTNTRIGILLFVLTISSVTVNAQPSGGPYGPIAQSYELPVANTIYYVSPEGNEESEGTSLNEPTSLKSAISRVVTGDAIVLRGGIYRTGEMVFNQGITLQPYKDEQPILKGTKIASEGVALSDCNVWRISWKHFFPSHPLHWWNRDRESVKTPVHRFNNDMVFVDGKPLQSAGWEGDVDENSYYIDYEKEQVFIGFDPAEHLVEITAFDGALIRTSSDVHGKVSDKKGPIIRGITFTQYARRGIEIEGKRSFGPMDEPTDEPIGPSDPATYGKEVIGTTLENVTITHCSRVAGFFRGDSLTIRNSLFSDTSTEGVYVIGSSDVLLEGNIFRRNNVENFTGYFPSAVKIFNQSHRVTCRNNLVMDNPNSSGIWYDVGNKNGVFVNNWVQNCTNGFFFEISKGAICVGNVFVDCENGIFVLNSSNVKAWNNTLINCSATFQRNNRRAGGHFGWHAATGSDVDERVGHVFANNLLVASSDFSHPLLKVEQTEDLFGIVTSSQLEKIDGNTYIHYSDTSSLFVWTPTETKNSRSSFKTLDEFRKLNPKFESQGKEFKSDIRSVFKSPELKNYELIKPVMETNALIALPKEIKNLISWDKKDILSPGAYPIKH